MQFDFGFRIGLKQVDIFRVSCPCLTNCLIARLHTNIEALLAVSIVRLGQDIIDVMENVALVKELVVRLLELQAPASKTKRAKTSDYCPVKRTRRSKTRRH